MKTTMAIVLLAHLVFLGNAKAAEEVTHSVSSSPAIVETWRLEPVWTLSGDDESAPLVGRVSKAEVTAEGQVLLLDWQMGRVVVLNNDGSLEGFVGRKGEGPGELENPSDLFMFSDGTVGIVQFYPKKTVRLLMDGTPADPILSDNLMGVYLQVRAANGVVVSSSQELDSKNTTKFISTYNHSINRRSLSGETQYTYLSKTTKTSINPPKFNEAASYFPAKVWDLAKDGTLLLAPNRDLYRIEFLSPEGNLKHVIVRDFTPWPRSVTELEKIESQRAFTIRGRKIAVESELEPRDPAIEQIQVHWDGAIWVSSCYGDRNLPVDVFRQFDVFEPNGEWRAAVNIVVDGDLEQDKLIALRDDRFLLVRNYKQASNASSNEELYEGDGVLEIVCLRRTRDN